MKKVLSLILAMIMVLSLVACGSNSGNAGNSSAGPQGASSDKTGGNSNPSRTDIKIPLDSVGTGLDPHNVPMGVDQHVTEQVYEGLYRCDPYTGELLPRLATSYEVSEDGMVYTYHLREGVTFHNGDPFTAADVVYNIERCFQNGYGKNTLNGVAGAEAVNDYTVNILMSEPNSMLPTNICMFHILNRNVLEELGELFPVTACQAGTGPYYLESYEQTSKIVLKAYPDYYLGKAAIETIEFIPIADSSTQLIAFESGQFDITTVSPADWGMISGNDAYTSKAGPGTRTTYVVVNVGKPDSPLYDLRVRQAIAYCINKEDMVAIAAEGLADVADYMVRPNLCIGAVETGVYYDHDVERARKLMAEAGYAGGFEVVILARTGENDIYIKTAEVLVENLAEIGITATIEQQESSTLLAGFKEATYDIGVSGVTWMNFNDYVPWIDGTRRANSDFSLNEHIDVDYIQELHSKALAATSLEEMNKYFGEMESYQQENGCGYLPTIYKQSLYAWDKNLNAVPPVIRYYVYDWSWN